MAIVILDPVSGKPVVIHVPPTEDAAAAAADKARRRSLAGVAARTR